jgi:protein tyrosine phosphatase
MVTETSSFFIPNQCLFGSYPSQEDINKLEAWGVDIIINLTSYFEKKIKQYNTTSKVIYFTIPDRGVPVDILKFCSLIVYIVNEINNKKKIYVHCKGGHGRAGLVVASLLCYKNKSPPSFALLQTSIYHSLRPIHSYNNKNNLYRKKKGAPQTFQQKQFVIDLFKNFIIDNDLAFKPKKEYDMYIMNTYLRNIYNKELELYREKLFNKLSFN